MKPMRPLVSLLAAAEKFLDRILCVLGAVLFSQVPEFFQQYLQRLGGHLDEARRQLGLFQDMAAQSGYTVEGLVAHLQSQTEPVENRLGSVVAQTAARVDSLSAAEAALRQSSVWSRPFVFLRHLDPGIARATISVFRPAVPTTVEGMIYAALGVLIALGLYYGAVRAPVRCAWRARARRRAAAGVSAGTG